MDIQAKIESVRQELNAENQRGALKDSSKVAELEHRLSNLMIELDSAQRESEYVAKIEENRAEVTNILDNITVSGISMLELCRDRESYQLLSAVMQQTITERDEKRLREFKEIEAKFATVRLEKEELQSSYDTLYEVSSQQRHNINSLKAELEDMVHKRDAAASELEEAKTEIDRLNSHIQDLHTQEALGARDSIKVTNLDDLVEDFRRRRAEETALRELEKENAKPVIYDVVDLDSSKNRFGAKFAATDEYFEDYYMYKLGKYREVTPEEAYTFRLGAEESQHTDANSEWNTVEEVELTQPTFQSGESAIVGLDEVNVGVEVATKTVEERLDALEVAVFGQVRDVA